MFDGVEDVETLQRSILKEPFNGVQSLMSSLNRHAASLNQPDCQSYQTHNEQDVNLPVGGVGGDHSQRPQHRQDYKAGAAGHGPIAHLGFLWRKVQNLHTARQLLQIELPGGGEVPARRWDARAALGTSRAIKARSPSNPCAQCVKSRACRIDGSDCS